MDLSLDDFIKKKRIGIKTGRFRPQSSMMQRSIPKRNLNTVNRNNSRKPNMVPPRRLQSNNSPRVPFSVKNNGVADARIKIIQKNRGRLLDARNKISQPKHIDLRKKIHNGHQQNMRPDRRHGNARVEEFRNKTSRMRPNNPILIKRSFRNNVSSTRSESSPELKYTIRNNANPLVVRRDLMDDDPPLHSPTSWSHNSLKSIKVVTPNDFLQQEYMPRVQEPFYRERLYEQPIYKPSYEPPRHQEIGHSGVRMSQQMRARLDAHPNTALQYNHHVQQSEPRVLHYPIIVSNLHPSVTHEDIKELFEDIGPLAAYRLLQPGVAEVVYKLQKDAAMAVEAYHNRQLDGLPMKCNLETPRFAPAPNICSGPLRSYSGPLRSNTAPLLPTPAKFPVSSKSMVVPDVNAIHKALFMSK